jgi:hypothetical protein
MNRLRKVLGAASVVALVGIGVVSASPRLASAGPQIHQQAKTTKSPPVFPALSVVDLKSGKAFKLSSLAATKKATLVWFWAPH